MNEAVKNVFLKPYATPLTITGVDLGGQTRDCTVLDFCIADYTHVMYVCGARLLYHALFGSKGIGVDSSMLIAKLT